MRRPILMTATLSWSLLVAVSCHDRGPIAPSPSATLDQLVRALEQQGLTVTQAGEIPPEVNLFFSVPAQQLLVSGSRVNAFEYPSSEAAAAEAALVRPDGSGVRQPGLEMLITWVSTPHFYQQGRLIALYLGCSTEIVRALEVAMGPPFVIGRTPCEFAR